MYDTFHAVEIYTGENLFEDGSPWCIYNYCVILMCPSIQTKTLKGMQI